MDYLERTNRIVEYLKIKPISHGQVDIRQIAIPESIAKEVSPERDEELSLSLTERGSNLIPLIIRRTETYSETEDYEIVYGADWCLAAKKRGINILWAWVFDLTDEQAAATKAEMERLAGSKSETVTTVIETKFDENLVNLIGKKLEAIQQENHQRHQEEFEKLQNSFQEKFSQLEQKIDDLKKTSTVEDLPTLIEEQLKTSRQLDKENALKLLNDTQTLLSKQATAIKKEIEKRKKEIQKINLLTATESEVTQALKSAKVGQDRIDAAWEAIEHWKQPEKLTWSNLGESYKNGSKHKIQNFGKATYDKLREIGDIEKPPSS
jgi:hypothetical protein